MDLMKKKRLTVSLSLSEYIAFGSKALQLGYSPTKRIVALIRADIAKGQEEAHNHAPCS